MSLRFKLTLISTLLALVVVVLGAYTRLVDAGLGCPDWPGCYGFLTVPNEDHEISLAEARFPDSPVEVHKGWPEMIHRYFAGTLGLFILGIAALSLKQRQQPGSPVKLPLLLVALVICQAAFGAWTVTLKLWPQVVTAHLLGGFATLSLLTLLSLRLARFNHLIQPSVATHRFIPWAIIGLLLVIGQIFLGGWMSANYASYACPDLPTCQTQWWPQMDFQKGFNLNQHIGPNYLGGTLDNASRVAIHMTHRIGAIIVTLYLLALFLRLKRATVAGSALQRATWLMLAALIIQVCLGLSNVYWLLPLPVAVAHNAFGALLLLTLVAINYLVIAPKQEISHG